MYMQQVAYMFTYPFSNVIENHHLAIPSFHSFRRVCRLFKSFPDSQPVDENALAIAFDKAPSLRRQMQKSTVDCWINRASPNDLSCGKNNNKPSLKLPQVVQSHFCVLALAAAMMNLHRSWPNGMQNQEIPLHGWWLNAPKMHLLEKSSSCPEILSSFHLRSQAVNP